MGHKGYALSFLCAQQAPSPKDRYFKRYHDPFFSVKLGGGADASTGRAELADCRIPLPLGQVNGAGAHPPRAQAASSFTWTSTPIFSICATR